MAQSGTLKRLAGPAYVASSATDIFNASSALIYSVLKHIHVANKTGGAVTLSLYVGATGGSAGGTELAGGLSIAANSNWDWYGNLKMVSTDFLSGLASAGSSLVITVEGEQVVV